ncbi:hypothetical protein [Klebsiella aerogenes]|uniref:hypothetical protein n=1 Tax=Klebsiella aerogenes TaxID=548 RepID=UPI003D310C2F
MSQLTLNLPAHNACHNRKHAGKSGYEYYRREFITLFRDTARYHNRYEVFRDFAEMGGGEVYREHPDQMNSRLVELDDKHHC